MSADSSSAFHPKNLHQGDYHFKTLADKDPGLAVFLKTKPQGGSIIDFSNASAVKALNTALLKHYYSINSWDIPTGYLCPPVPGRVDYIHHLADLIEENSRISIHDNRRVLDIGIGANGIYSLLGVSVYNWRMVGTEIDSIALASVTKILDQNPDLKENIDIRLQVEPHHILQGIIKKNEHFDATICNPPFYNGNEFAELANQKKQEKHQKLGIFSSPKVRTFQGRPAELYCEGGERQFIATLINESQLYANQCKWFTTLVSRQSTLPHLLIKLKKAEISTHRVIPMKHGNKQSRILAWSYTQR